MLKSEPVRRCNLGECHANCCLHGAWVDQIEIKDILSHAEMIAQHMQPGLDDPTKWFDDRQEPDPYAISGNVGHTAVLSAPDHCGGTACIFLRSDYKCALQVAVDERALHPWRFKPFYCILHPLDLDEQGCITIDKTATMLNEPGSCLHPAKHPIPLIETFSNELRYLLGEKNFRDLKHEK